MTLSETFVPGATGCSSSFFDDLRKSGPAAPDCCSESGRSATKRATERRREMTVAGESQIEGERREVVRVWQFDERTGQTKLHEVTMQRNAFMPAEEIGEIAGDASTARACRTGEGAAA